MKEILNERAQEYGDFKTFAEISQSFKRILNHYNHLSEQQREALEMIFHKIARILNGNPNNIDSWKDIAGYSLLVVNILEKK